MIQNFLICGLLVAVALLSGCGTAFIGGRSSEADASDRAALHYYLPQDAVEVVVTLERTTLTGLREGDGGPETFVKISTAAVGATVNLQTVADTSQSFVLDANATGLSKNNTALSVTETGLLQSVNAKSTGSGGVVFDNVMKIAGSVLPLVKLANGQFDLSAVPLAADPLEGVVKSSGSFLSRANPTAFVLLDEEPEAGTCDEHILLTQFLSNSIEYRFAFARHLPNKTYLIAQFCESLATLKQRRKSYSDVLDQFEQATDGAVIGLLNTKLTRLRNEYTLAATAHLNAREAIIAAVTLALQNEGLGKKSEKFTQRAVFQLSTLPVPDVLHAYRLTTAQTDAEFRRLIQELHPATTQAPGAVAPPPPVFSVPMQQLFEATGIVVTAEPVGVPPLIRPADISDEGYVACRKSKTKKSSSPCVFYRASQPYLLTAWTTQKVPEESSTGSNVAEQASEKLRLVQSDSKIVDAIPDTAEVLAIELRDSLFTKRDSTLTFTARGRLTAVARDYGSAAEDASSSISSGLTNGIAQYATTLTSLKTIRATENDIELQPLTQQLAVATQRSAIALQPVQAQVAMAQQQLAALNAQLSLQSTTAGKDTILKTQAANIDQLLAAAQVTLATSQASLVSAQTTAQQTEQQAALTASTAMLSAQISELQSELALLKLKQQLEEIKKPKEQ
jgi:hypothetical protein